MSEIKIIAGVDEAGRGPLAGPVIAAAVILKHPIDGLNDSKKLTEKKRKALFVQIQNEALSFALGRAEVNEIDELNIHHATLLAMKRAVEGLSIMPDHCLIDGKFCPEVRFHCEAVVNGDALIAEISAASILAKVTRDEELLLLDEEFPQYGFAAHKGYGTAKHMEALLEYGPCQHHRQSFAPVSKLVAMNGL